MEDMKNGPLSYKKIKEKHLVNVLVNIAKKTQQPQKQTTKFLFQNSNWGGHLEPVELQSRC